TTYSIDGAIDPDVLRDAFTHVVARHDQLRLRIVADDGPPRASIRPPEPAFRLSVVDLRRLDAAARERVRTLYAVREAAVPIALDVRAGQNGADALFQRLRVDDAAGRAARRFARATGVSLYVLGLALLGVQLRRRTGRADLVVATPFVGRRFPRFTDTVGLFV